MAFSLRDVSFSYGGGAGIVVKALDIEPRGLTAVIGPSGSGKTTFLSILAGFLRPRIGPGGHLKLGGHCIPPTGHPPGRVGFVFQAPMLLGAASGLVNVLQGRVSADAAGSPDRTPLEVARLHNDLASIGLLSREGSLLSARARSISGGEAQRFAILRAVLSDPDAILCDEPTSSLDEANATLALKMLRTWSARTGRPVVWVTHDLEQAARHADHYVFLSQGRIHEPSDVGRDLLRATVADDDPQDHADRVQLLREIASELTGTASATPARPDAAGPDADHGTVSVGRVTYARWIAEALSNDAPGRKDAGAPHLPSGVRALLRRLLLSAPGPGGSLRRAVRYSQSGLAGILVVLMAQILAAQLVGLLATAYADERLDDPSVARIVFEREDGRNRLDDLPEPPELRGSQSIRALEAQVDAALSISGETQIMGRRQVSGSRLRLHDSSVCPDWLDPLATVVLDAADPLLTQTDLTRDLPEIRGAAPAHDETLAPDIAAARPVIADRSRPAILLHPRVVAVLRARCGLDPAAPIRADWATGPAGTIDGNAVTVEVVGAIGARPPLHPYVAEMIAFEQDYQAAKIAEGATDLDPFQIAAAYFPIDGFEAAEATLAAAGYTIRDDSAAAVQELQRVANAARVVPPIVVWFNLTACAIVVLLTVDALLELNKRVLALFAAHGFRLTDMLMALGLHLAPAFGAAALVVAALALGLWPILVYLGWVPTDIDSATAMRNAAILSAWGRTLVVTTVAVMVVTALWWRRTRRDLKSYLQE